MLLIALLSGCLFINFDDDCARDQALGLGNCWADTGWWGDWDTGGWSETEDTTREHTYRSWWGTEEMTFTAGDETCTARWQTLGEPVSPMYCTHCTFMFEVDGTLEDAESNDCGFSDFTYRYGYSASFGGEENVWVYGYYDRYYTWGEAVLQSTGELSYRYDSDTLTQEGAAAISTVLPFSPTEACAAFSLSIEGDSLTTTDRLNLLTLHLVDDDWSGEDDDACVVTALISDLTRDEAGEKTIGARRLWTLSESATLTESGRCDEMLSLEDTLGWPWSVGIADPTDDQLKAHKSGSESRKAALFAGIVGTEERGYGAHAGGVARGIEAGKVTQEPIALPETGLPEAAHFSAASFTCLDLD